MTCPVKESKGEEGFELYFSRGRMNVLKSILEGQIPLSRQLAEWVYQCSECGNCSEVCHMTQNDNIILPTCNWIDHVKVWEALRKDLIESGFAPLERHDLLIKNITNEKMENPYGEKRESKIDWTEEFPQLKEKGDYAFFVGCTIPLRQRDTLKNLMKILKVSNLTFALIKEERCCGSIGLRIGDSVSITDIIKHNVEAIKETEAK
ncbi:MAG: heterodisulfide reductase-related iron-sulfur binding cluster, partial [Candidatus Thorarchaeota archaeon]